MPFERTDIRTRPEYPLIVFGDYFIAQIIKMVQGKNAKGEDIWKMTLIPTPELAKKYNVTMDMLDENLSIPREYPIDMIKLENSDPSWTVYSCLVNFNGEDCPNQISSKIYIESLKVQGLRRMIDLMKGENAWLREQLEKAKTNIAQFIKEYIMAPASEMNISQILQSQQQPGTTGFQMVSPVRTQ
jgi:hypothetical protein